jgi:hypothetical protein
MDRSSWPDCLSSESAAQHPRPTFWHPQAEADAADAIEFAAWTVDHARLAGLDAIDARVYADDLARSAGA